MKYGRAWKTEKVRFEQILGGAECANVVVVDWEEGWEWSSGAIGSISLYAGETSSEYLSHGLKTTSLSVASTVC